MADKAPEPCISKLLSSFGTELDNLCFFFQEDALWRNTVRNGSYSEEMYFNINLFGLHYIFPSLPLSYLKIKRGPPREPWGQIPKCGFGTVLKKSWSPRLCKEICRGGAVTAFVSGLSVSLFPLPLSRVPSVILEPLSALSSEEMGSSWLLFSA